MYEKASKSPKPLSQQYNKKLDDKMQVINDNNKNDLTRNSIVEFEQLEKECIDKYSPYN